MRRTLQLLLDQSGPVELEGLFHSVIWVGGHMVDGFELGRLIPDFLLENLDVSLQGLLGGIATSGSTLEGGDPAFHLLPFNFP